MSFLSRPLSAKISMASATGIVGGGMFARASLWSETRPSLLPVSTSNQSPPACNSKYIKVSSLSYALFNCYSNQRIHAVSEESLGANTNTNTYRMRESELYILTTCTADLAAIMRRSAQETTPGHAFSTASFSSSIVSNPPRVKFGTAVFSVSCPSRKTDASHPFSTHHVSKVIVNAIKY